jgi:hypothetical protein
MRRIALAGVLAALLLASPASAATLEPVGNFTNPTYVTSYPNDAEKLLVVERGGREPRVEGLGSAYRVARAGPDTLAMTVVRGARG